MKKDRERVTLKTLQFENYNITRFQKISAIKEFVSRDIISLSQTKKTIQYLYFTNEIQLISFTIFFHQYVTG
jgi:hypothetical protein